MVTKKTIQQPESESVSEYESESESESEKQQNPNLKSAPEQQEEEEESESEYEEEEEEEAPKSQQQQQPESETEEEEEARPVKPSVSKRIWSLTDEILILKEFINYKASNKVSPLSNMPKYHAILMKTLPESASQSQLYEKIRRLKKKFRLQHEKLISGQHVKFTKSHDKKLFDVSELIWGFNGCEPICNDKRKTVNKPKLSDEAKEFETLYPYWNAGLKSVEGSLNFPKGVVDCFRKEFGLIDRATAMEFNEKWKVQFTEEAALQKMKNDLLKEVAKNKAV